MGTSFLLQSVVFFQKSSHIPRKPISKWSFVCPFHISSILLIWTVFITIWMYTSSPGAMSMISVVKLDIVLSLQFNWTLLPQIPYWRLWFPPRTMSCCLGQAVSGGSTDYLTSTYRATVRYWEIQTLAVRCWEMLLPLLYVCEKFCYTWCKQRVT